MIPACPDIHDTVTTERVVESGRSTDLHTLRLITEKSSYTWFIDGGFPGGQYDLDDFYPSSIDHLSFLNEFLDDEFGDH